MTQSNDVAAANRVGDLLVSHRLLTNSQASDAADLAAEKGMMFGDAAVELGFIDAATLRETLNLHFALSRIEEASPDAWSRSPLNQPNHELSGDLRAIRNNLALRLNMPRSEGGCIAIVSAEADDGGSTFAAQLAISFCGVGYRTLLVDGNLTQPRQHELFALGVTQGLADYLDGRASKALLIDMASLKNLTVLPAGRSMVSAGDLLLRPHLHRLLSGARHLFDIVLVDTPAAETGPDYLLLAAECGNALLVTRQQRTTTRAVQQITRDCTANGVTMLGATMVGPHV